MSDKDILKNQMRREIKAMRRSMDKSEKAACDEAIFRNLVLSGVLSNAETVLVYHSTEIEVGTEKIIAYCLENGIKTALPRCTTGHRMNFYYFEKGDTLQKSDFGIMEPFENPEREVKSFEKTVCIVPALSYDKDGYRLGYGGGFYDRFLAEHEEILPVGICYNENICEMLVRNEFDRKVSLVVTEKNPEENNGKK